MDSPMRRGLKGSIDIHKRMANYVSMDSPMRRGLKASARRVVDLARFAAEFPWIPR